MFTIANAESLQISQLIMQYLLNHEIMFDLWNKL